MVTTPSEQNGILDELKALRQDFAQKISHDQLQQTAFERLHVELQQYKDDFLAKSQTPVLLDLLLFYDSLNWFQESLIKQDMSPEVLEENFQYLIDELLELLYRRNVHPMEARTQFDRTVHKAVQVVETDNPDHNELVTTVLKRGFRHGDRTLRAEEVIVARHQSTGSQ
jgi:molecular chaperone GrpE (heat shock protein)